MRRIKVYSVQCTYKTLRESSFHTRKILASKFQKSLAYRIFSYGDTQYRNKAQDANGVYVCQICTELCQFAALDIVATEYKLRANKILFESNIMK